MADKSLNRSDLVAAIAAETGASQVSVGATLDALFAVVSNAVADGTKVAIPGWISFEQTQRAARTGRNPKTGEPVEIPERMAVKFSAGKALDDWINP